MEVVEYWSDGLAGKPSRLFGEQEEFSRPFG